MWRITVVGVLTTEARCFHFRGGSRVAVGTADRRDRAGELDPYAIFERIEYVSRLVPARGAGNCNFAAAQHSVRAIRVDGFCAGSTLPPDTNHFPTGVRVRLCL